jgi:hypothetical protein
LVFLLICGPFPSFFLLDQETQCARRLPFTSSVPCHASCLHLPRRFACPARIRAVLLLICGPIFPLLSCCLASPVECSLAPPPPFIPSSFPIFFSSLATSPGVPRMGPRSQSTRYPSIAVVPNRRAL